MRNWKNQVKKKFSSKKNHPVREGLVESEMNQTD